MMRRFLFFGLVLGVTGCGTAACRAAEAQSLVDPAVPRRTADIVLVADAETIAGSIQPGVTLDGLFARHDVAEDDRHALVAAVRSVFDVRRMRVGQPFVMDRRLDGRVRRFEYEIDGDQRLRVQSDESRAFVAVIETIPKEVTVDAVEGRISREAPSLTQALDAVNERLDLALAMADIFSGELDFSSELQPGDEFRLVVERKTREGSFAGYGAILAAEFVASGRALRAYRYAPKGGRPAYFDGDGRSLKRFFLKSPLRFEPRITSRFSSARRHPILKYTRAHNGVDYSAPTGAPVVAVAPGTVTLAGWTSGGGRTVRIRHTNGYESEYLHLSALHVRAGTRVSQGDLVGKVGATGLATGPHLHYGLRRNGAYVNPVVEHRNMPPGDPVPAVELAAFVSERTRLSGLLPPLALRSAN